MKVFSTFALCWLIAYSLFGAASQSLTIQGNAYATYSGPGVMSRSLQKPWSIAIAGVTGTASGTLSIKSTSPTSRNRVYIDSINCDGGLSSLLITFQPGSSNTPQGTYANYVRNIHIAGDLKTLKIEGGDLGSSDARDGQVTIGGNLDTLNVNGKSFKVDDPYATFPEWWGGNCWADISVSGTIKKISSKGGNFYYSPTDGAGILGTIAFNGNCDNMLVQGTKFKTNATDSILIGGCINSHFSGQNTSTIKEIRCLGGLITGGKIACQRLEKLTFTGPKPTDQHCVPINSQGVFKTYVETADNGVAGNDVDMTSITIKYGNIRDSRVAVQGGIGSLNLTGDTNSCVVSNVVMRSGFVGDLCALNSQPNIYPSSSNFTVYAGTKIVFPFYFSGQSGDELSTRIHFRDRAYSSILSNNYGNTYWGPDFWRTTVVSSVAIPGYFVWLTYTNDIGFSSNIIIRVRNNGIPNKYRDLTLGINVITNANPVHLIVNLVPADASFTNSLVCTNAVGLRLPTTWKLEVALPDDQGFINYTATGDDAFLLGIAITNNPGDSKSVFATTSTVQPARTYSNIVFTANNGFLSDFKTVTLVLTGATPKAATSKAIIPAVTLAPRKAGIGSYPINKISTVGGIYDSLFVANYDDSLAPYVWNDVPSYYDPIKSLKIQGVALSNTFVSKKKINIANSIAFNFTNNYIWIQGKRAMDNTQE